MAQDQLSSGEKSEQLDLHESALDLLVAILPAMLVLIGTLAFTLGVIETENLFIVQSRVRIIVRFLLLTGVLLVPLPIFPSIMVFIGKKMTKEGFLGRLVKDRKGLRVEFEKSLLWILRPLQGIGLSMIFSNQLLNLFRSYPETSFLSSLIRPLLFIVISIPISILFSFIWSLDDLGVKLYSKKTGQVRLVGSYFGTILPVISGIVGVYSLFQRSAPMEALLLVILIVMVLYPPYVVFAVVHHKFLSKRNNKIFNEFLLNNIEVKMA